MSQNDAYESYYVIARPPVAVGFEEKNDRRRKTWKMAVVSITAKWIVDQLLTRFKLALGFSNLVLSLVHYLIRSN